MRGPLLRRTPFRVDSKPAATVQTTPLGPVHVRRYVHWFQQPYSRSSRPRSARTAYGLPPAAALIPISPNQPYSVESGYPVKPAYSATPAYYLPVPPHRPLPFSAGYSRPAKYRSYRKQDTRKRATIWLTARSAPCSSSYMSSL